MQDLKYESMSQHMKGFIQGLLFILIIIIIIAFFHVIAYFDQAIVGNNYSDNGEVEYWNENIEKSDGIRSGGQVDKSNELYEGSRKDFGSKSLNEKDREEKAKAKEESAKKSYDYLKK